MEEKVLFIVVIALLVFAGFSFYNGGRGDVSDNRVDLDQIDLTGYQVAGGVQGRVSNVVARASTCTVSPPDCSDSKGAPLCTCTGDQSCTTYMGHGTWENPATATCKSKDGGGMKCECLYFKGGDSYKPVNCECSAI